MGHRARRLRRLTLAQARRIAISAQGLAGAPAQARPCGPVTMRHLQRLIDRIALLQIDSVNVLARAHELPVLARLGPYDRHLLDRATHGTPSRPRRLVETFAHEAALVAPQTYHLLRWTMATPRRLDRLAALQAEHPQACTAVLDLITAHGPMTAAQIHTELGHDRAARVHWGWNWTLAKQVAEAAFAAGVLASAGRNRQFERRYDLARRVLPADLYDQDPPGRTAAMIDLITIAARAHGIGTVRCLADYFRMPMAHTREAVEHLCRTGVLEQVHVEGWAGPVYHYAAAPVPRATRARALVAPFDPLVFERTRLHALFGMHYRIGIYTPAAQRTHGYYVLPFVLGEQIAARVDLKADRPDGTLLVRTAFAEPQAPAQLGAELVAELQIMATWLGLGRITIANDARGDLIEDLAARL